MSFNLIAVLLLCLAPLAIATTTGLWLILLGGIGLPMLVRRIQAFTSPVKKIIYHVVLAISWGGAIVLLLDFYLGLWLSEYPSVIFLACWDPFFRLAEDYSRTATAFADWWTEAPLVWTVLAVEGPLVPLAHFGTPAVLKLLGIAEDRSRHVTARITGTMLLVGIVTGLLGFGWAVWIAFTNPDGIGGHMGFGLIPLLLSLCPVNLLLAIGLPVWLNMAGDHRVETTTGAKIATAIAAAVVIAGTIGAILSVLHIQVYR